MRKLLLSLISILFFSSLAIADNGLISIKSSHDVKVTADRLEKNLKMKGMTVFTRINHAKGAQKVGKKLRPTELIIFGKPKIGAPLMQCGQSVAIDLQSVRHGLTGYHGEKGIKRVRQSVPYRFQMKRVCELMIFQKSSLTLYFLAAPKFPN